MASGVSGIEVNILLVCPRNICCGYSFEAPQRGASNEYSQHTFSWTKRDISAVELEKMPYLVLYVFFR